MSLEDMRCYAIPDLSGGKPFETEREPVRAHHWDGALEINAIKGIVHTDATSVREFCVSLAWKIVQEQLTSPPEDYGKMSFREYYGGPEAKEDDSLPATYGEDIVGDNPIKIIKSRADGYFDFLVMPETTPVTVGPVMDAICKGCAFNHGEGGYHCESVDVQAEDSAALKLQKAASSYLQTVTGQELRSRDPGKYVVTNDIVEIQPPFRLAPRLSIMPPSNRVLQVHMTLGFLRDIMVERVTRYTGNDFFTYNDLMESKDIPIWPSRRS